MRVLSPAPPLFSHLPPPFSWKHKMKNIRTKIRFSVFILSMIDFLKFLFLKWSFSSFLTHLTQRVMWAIAITWRPSYVVNFFKNLLLWKYCTNGVSSFKIVSDDAVYQPTWPLLLKIEHMVKLHVLGNNSKTVNNIKNLTWVKNDQHIKNYLPCNFEVNLITHLGVIALFSSNL